ncbi:MAG: hypothetical protein AB7N76_02355 [Planctomycetota bacterium]
MGIKQDRQIDFNDDGIVVYVAKSKEEVDQARAALHAAGVMVELPEAAVEALFAAGRESLPIRVPAMSFRKAQDVIDELFPPPVIDLPDDDPPPGADAPAAGGEGGAELSGYQPQAASSPKGAVNPRQVAESANKVVFVALASFLLVGPGLLIGLFALIAAWWCLDNLPKDSSAREKAKIALGLALASCAWNAVGAWLIASRMGWIR